MELEEEEEEATETGDYPATLEEDEVGRLPAESEDESELEEEFAEAMQEEEAPFDHDAGPSWEAVEPSGENESAIGDPELDGWREEEVDDEWEAIAEEEVAAAEAGTLTIDKVPLLRQHRGNGPDLILVWNRMPAAPTSVDVVVHFHGYAISAGSRLDIARDIRPRSGLDWSDPQGLDSASGRSRPTLGLLPRGHFFGGKSDRGYSFPALATKAGFQELLDFGLQHLAKALGVNRLTLDRLILTAHSGGGAALLRVLKFLDPHEVHVFDGLYQDPETLIRWARSRIDRDLRADSASAVGDSSRGGALRILFGPTSVAGSQAVDSALRPQLAQSAELARRYRVERTATPHLRIPPEYGWRLLADAAADLPGVPYRLIRHREKRPTRELSESEDEATTAAGLRQRLIEIALDEWNQWGRGTKHETSPDVTSALQKYYAVGVKENHSAADLRSPAWQADHAWSAVFISYVMRQAGAGDAFAYSRAHRTYVCAAKRARESRPPDATKFWAYRITEAKPEPGDLVCKDREAHKGVCAGTSFDNVCRGGKSHCDIVISVDATHNQITAIGGNVNPRVDGKIISTVGRKTISLDPGGYLPAVARNGCQFIAVLKPPGSRLPAPTARGALDYLASLPTTIADAVRAGAIGLQVGIALASGQRDANALTNMVFYARHPDLPVGYRIAPHERQLIQEWKQIREGVVVPLLARLSSATGTATTLRTRAASVGTSPAVGVPATRAAPSLGIDTASVAGNKNPDWVEAKSRVPVEFAIIRSNWGVSEDRTFKRDWPAIKAAGVVRGAYLFLRFPHPKHGMKAPDPASQASVLIKAVGSLDEADLPPTVDVEFPGGRKLTGMTAQQCLGGVRAAWKVLKDHYGVAPIVYTSARVWKEDLDNLSAPDLIESPLWLARYPYKKGPAVYDAQKVARLSSPPVPPPWGDVTNWWIHQYQGDAVRLPGFATGNVDMNRFNVTAKGAAGDRVKWVQRRLGIPETGVWDDALESALRAFQGQKGLVDDGVINPRVFAFLCWSHPAA